MLVDRSGGYYGGEGFHFGLVRPPELATLVLYSARKTEVNKIGMGLLFHRFIIIGRGLTDLNQQTAAVRTALAETSPRSCESVRHLPTPDKSPSRKLA